MIWFDDQILVCEGSCLLGNHSKSRIAKLKQTLKYQEEVDHTQVRPHVGTWD